MRPVGEYSRLPDGLAEVLAGNSGRVDAGPLLLHLNSLQHAAIRGERTGNKAQQDYQGLHGRWSWLFNLHTERTRSATVNGLTYVHQLE